MRRTASFLLLCVAVFGAGAVREPGTAGRLPVSPFRAQTGDAGDSPGDVEDEFSKESMVQVQFPKGLFPGDQKLRHSEALFGRPSYGSAWGAAAATPRPRAALPRFCRHSAAASPLTPRIRAQARCRGS